jgi:hypothetical protein
LANGCVAATVPEPTFLRELETGQMLSLEVVNSNVVTVIASLSLENFANARQGVAAQVFEQKLEGIGNDLRRKATADSFRNSSWRRLGQ